MAVDQNLVPKELLRRFSATSSAASSGEGDDHSSHRKLKLLCSYGGRILPRPSDGSLRYVGGHTRIISLQKDVSFLEFDAKMADTLGGPSVVFKYQLPGEDLDALVSVSCPEDLLNLIEEYDKLAAAASDGSAKLRAFLFTPAELAADPSSQVTTMDDTLHRYLEAINGVASRADVIDGNWRRDSGASVASSTQASDHGTPKGDAVDGGSSEVYVGHGNAPKAMATDVLPQPDLGIPAQNRIMASKEQPQVTPFASPAYTETHQLQYLQTQRQVVAGGGPQSVKLVPVMVHHYVPGAPVATMPVSAQVDGLKPVQDKGESNVENYYGGCAIQQPSDRNIKPLSQLPPLPPAYMQYQNLERYDLNQDPVPPISQPQILKLNDCLMCQRELPHAHSDTLIHDQAINGVGSAPEANPVFYSHRPEDKPKQKSSVLATEADQNIENASSARQAAGYLVPQFNQSQRHASVMPIEQNVENLNWNLNHANLLHQHAVGFQGEAQASNGMVVGNPMQSYAGGPLQWQQQHVLQVPQQSQYPAKQEMFAHSLNFPDSQGQQHWTFQPPHYAYKQEVVTNQTDASTINLNFMVGDPVNQNYVDMPSYDYIRPVGDKMEALHFNHLETPEYVYHEKPSRPHLGALGDAAYENPHNIGHPYGENAAFINSNVVNPGYILDGNFVKPIEQLPSANVNAHLHTPQLIEPNQSATMMGEHGPFSYNLGAGLGHPVPFENSFRPAAGSLAVGNARDDSMTLKDDGYHLQSREMFGYMAAAPSGYVAPHLPYSTGPEERMEAFAEPLSSESHPFNHDLQNAPNGMNLVPPKPTAVNHSVALKDSRISNQLVMSNGSNMVVMLEEGNLYRAQDSVANNSCFDPDSLSKEVSDEEQIKKQLQAVAEDVAASVLQSDPSLTSDMAYVAHQFHPDLNNDLGSDENQNSDAEKDINTNNLQQFGIQLGDDMGHLQIIKNIDLEELRELGSGTFGTVYHGKWRGTDVAIKRINDRCFTGKQSEQERMRTDFWNEACKLAELHHPNVVAFYGIVLDGPGGCVSTVTEYMVNGSLRQALQKNDKTLDRRKRILIALDVAFGMEYLHGKNIIHFDLKSDNLLVNLRDPQRPICKVGDLGLSKVKCKTLISGGMRGTLPWMAPELLYGNDSLVSEKVDVYSFGIVMWELFTGEEPYSDLHYGAIIGGILSNSLRPPVPDSSESDWVALMEQCWSAEPSERPSFTGIADGLRLMAASLPTKGQVQAQK